RWMPAGDTDQSLFHQDPQDVTTLYTTDALDVRAHDRLAIGDDSERFACGRGEPQLGRRLPQSNQPRMKLRSSKKLITTGQLLDLEGGTAAFVQSLQPAHGDADLSWVLQSRYQGQASQR